LLIRTKVAAMPSGASERYDFFLSRRGSVAALDEGLDVPEILRREPKAAAS
jgi:hypothetical protein